METTREIQRRYLEGESEGSIARSMRVSRNHTVHPIVSRMINQKRAYPKWKQDNADRLRKMSRDPVIRRRIALSKTKRATRG